MKHSLKILGWVLMVLPGSQITWGTPDTEDRNNFNVLMIAVDDLKPLIGAYGANIPTPGMDRLAKMGTTFSSAYCQQAVCGPSRASVMTGLRPDTTQVWDLKTRMRDINPDVLTIPQYFKELGYYSVGGGKIFDFRCVDNGLDTVSWSEPYTKESMLPFHKDYPKPKTYYRNPKSQQLVGQALVKGLEGWNPINQYLFENDGWPTVECLDVPDDAYDDGAIANFALAGLDRLGSQEQPFFLAVGFKKPHLPFIAPKKYWDQFDRDQIELAPYQEWAKDSPDFAWHESNELRSYNGVPSEGPLDEETQRELIHGYMACVAYIDAQIAKILDHLEQSGLIKNTIIVLWGDHGWHLGDHGIWCKHTNYEQATRVPFIIVSPGGVEGFTTDMPVELTDLFPTLCHLTGLPVPVGLEGTNLKPTLTEKDESIREFALSQYPRAGKMGYAIRTERYRLVHWYEVDQQRGAEAGDELLATELYDYQVDSHETRNLANDPSYEQELRRLSKLLIAEVMN